MNLSKAKAITDAAAAIGKQLVGKSKSVGQEHIDIIRSVSLAQIQTASDTIMADNLDIISAADTRVVHTVCDNSLIVRVKLWADSIKVWRPHDSQ